MTDHYVAVIETWVRRYGPLPTMTVSVVTTDQGGLTSTYGPARYEFRFGKKGKLVHAVVQGARASASCYRKRAEAVEYARTLALREQRIFFDGARDDKRLVGVVAPLVATLENLGWYSQFVRDQSNVPVD